MIPPLVAIAVSSVYLAPTGRVYFVAAVAQAAFYAIALAGFALRRAQVGGARAVYIPFYYCLANAASAVALMQFVLGRRVESWQPQRHAAS